MDHLKRVADEFSRQAQTFERWAEKTDDQVASRFRGALGEAARGHLLDVACGPGVVTAALAPGAASVVAFDATEQMLEKARSRCAKAGLANVDFKCGDAENLPFADGQFDGVVTRLAVHHFADPQRALGEMFRVLRHGGVAVVVDIVSSENPVESNLQNAIERLRDPSHVRMLPAAELDGLLARMTYERYTPRTIVQRSALEAELRRIQLGQSTSTVAAVTSGLSDGEKVIVEGLQKVRAGQAVAPGPASALIQSSMNANPEEGARKKDGIGAKAAGTTP